MRILDDLTDVKLDMISLFLTRTEAEDLISSLEDMIADKKITHAHVMSDDYKKEIMVCVYDSENVKTFNERVQKLIKDDQ